MQNAKTFSYIQDAPAVRNAHVVAKKVQPWNGREGNLFFKPPHMTITLPGFTYKQYVGPDGETREKIYETRFEIDLESIEALTPSTGPEEAPDHLPYSRIVTKSGRFYDIKLSFKELREKINRARQEQERRRLLIISQ